MLFRSGADSIKLHLKNIAWYRQMAEHKEETDRDLETIFTEIRKLANHHFPKELKEWIKIKERFDEQTLNLFDYLKRTKFLSLKFMPPSNFQIKYPAIDRLLSAEDVKGKAAIQELQAIDYRILFQEIDHLEKTKIKVLPMSERQELFFIPALCATVMLALFYILTETRFRRGTVPKAVQAT